MQRTRHQINYPETYNLIFERLRNELRSAAASDQPIKHLIVLLGIPIAYPVRTRLFMQKNPAPGFQSANVTHSV